jgi:hypothetical protein
VVRRLGCLGGGSRVVDREVDVRVVSMLFCTLLSRRKSRHSLHP